MSMYRYTYDNGQEITIGDNMVTEAVMHMDLTTTWVGILSLAIFVVAYYFIAAEDKYHIFVEIVTNKDTNSTISPSTMDEQKLLQELKLTDCIII